MLSVHQNQVIIMSYDPNPEIHALSGVILTNHPVSECISHQLQDDFMADSFLLSAAVICWRREQDQIQLAPNRCVATDSVAHSQVYIPSLHFSNRKPMDGPRSLIHFWESCMKHYVVEISQTRRGFTCKYSTLQRKVRFTLQWVKTNMSIIVYD